MEDKEYRWWALATYNSERTRGIMHTSEWKEKMAREQELFNAERDAEIAEHNRRVAERVRIADKFRWSRK